MLSLYAQWGHLHYLWHRGLPTLLRGSPMLHRGSVTLHKLPSPRRPHCSLLVLIVSANTTESLLHPAFLDSMENKCTKTPAEEGRVSPQPAKPRPWQQDAIQTVRPPKVLSVGHTQTPRRDVSAAVRQPLHLFHLKIAQIIVHHNWGWVSQGEGQSRNAVSSSPKVLCYWEINTPFCSWLCSCQ